MAIFDITVMVIVIIFVYQAGRCVPGFLIAFVHEVGVCVCVLAHACVCVPATRLLITSGMIKPSVIG